MINFLHTNLPSRVLLDLGIVSLNWYGFLLVVGIIAGFFISYRLFVSYKISTAYLWDLGFYLIVFGFFGARLYHVLNEIGYYWQRPGQILAVWNGGLALHGALIAGLATIYVYIKKNYSPICSLVFKRQVIKRQARGKNIKESSTENKSNPLFALCLLLLADILAPALAIGQSIGRWGNYFNQELYGQPTNLPWGIPIALENRVAGYEQFNFFQPTFFYESLATFFIFLILITLHSQRLRQLSQPQSFRSFLSKPGSITAIYLIFYSLVRILMEFIRIDLTPIILGIRLPILVSFCLIVAGGWLLIFSQKRFS